ncbi:MAG TPA: glycoside hydrolase, partial [Spirochaetia bacterium]|nr:glycoside hydrolase [Spirochaetia bacterium]
MTSLFYKPQDAWAADFIPLYSRGTYQLFYLLDWRDRDRHGEGTPWYRISTRDFVSFQEHGEMLSRGTAAEQDLYVFTGSVLEAEGAFHIFYTGHNPHLRKAGKPEQGVMHAVSSDLASWRKVPEDTFYAPAGRYEAHDWRDPFVFWNEEAGEYWMLLAARGTAGPPRRRGCTALCSSRDLRRWEVREPLWSPGLYFTHECPDLFRMGDWWYLLYSTFTERFVTHYRMSRSLRGPWLVPESDTFDGRGLYAAKTAGDGNRRFLFGWNATRDKESDTGAWQWGGSLVVHELTQRPDGALAVKIPETVDRAFGPAVPVRFVSGLGRWKAHGNAVAITGTDSWGCVSAGALPPACRISATVRFSAGTQGCGILLRTSDDLETGYYVRLEPARRRLVMDSWPRPGDKPFWLELERPVPLDAGSPHRIVVLVEGSICEVYLDDRVAM